MNQCLFICTGNYYRSRLAEAIFNFQCTGKGIAWRAVSRGLDIHRVQGDLSPVVDKYLISKKIPREMTGSTRRALLIDDFLQSTRMIALQQHEHHPLMQKQFPQWADKIEYWHVADAEFLSPQLAMRHIDQLVTELVTSLQTSSSAPV